MITNNNDERETSSSFQLLLISFSIIFNILGVKSILVDLFVKPNTKEIMNTKYFIFVDFFNSFKVSKPNCIETNTK